MGTAFSLESVQPLRGRLHAHPIYGAIGSVEALRVFMGHHVFSVWDFMSLVKSLQGTLAPVRVPWTPVGDASARRFINQIVLEEESDSGPPTPDGHPAYLSHFELYCQAMEEVGAAADTVRRFVALAGQDGVGKALAAGQVPAAAQGFVRRTFGFIETGKPHVIAAAFALGREHIIPEMFRAILRHFGVEEAEAPAFHYYLRRHIHLDEDFHGPLSLHLLDVLCGGDPGKVAEAEQAAREAIEARIAFWDGVLVALR